VVVPLPCGLGPECLLPKKRIICHFAAENRNMGTWKLNEAKSMLSPVALKNTTTIVYEAAGDSVKATTDGTSSDGKTMQTE